MNIFEEIRSDHQKQRRLMSLLVKTSGDSEGREELFDKISQELKDHADAEEKYLYAPLMKADQTRDKTRHSIHEHQEIDKLIDELQSTDFSSPHWLATAKELQHQVEHHLDEEEHEVFQMAGKVLSEKQKQSLATSFRKRREELSN